MGTWRSRRTPWERGRVDPGPGADPGRVTEALFFSWLFLFSITGSPSCGDRARFRSNTHRLQSRTKTAWMTKNSRGVGSDAIAVSAQGSIPCSRSVLRSWRLVPGVRLGFVPDAENDPYDRYSGNISPIALFLCCCGCGRIDGGLWGQKRWRGSKERDCFRGRLQREGMAIGTIHQAFV